ncbi:MAG TPA: DNA-directed RNA polymerase subunit delta [Candidatus Faecimonas gallistercoris]|nr:DNA-directed RNA polymerase subunit delta [Candidatus Faecimonas gallistercoris]
MSLSKMKKEELELLSNKDITKLILEESKKTLNTADLFKKIIKLLDLPANTFETKIGDYYTSLSTDKRFILLDDGSWDLRSRHTSDKIAKITEEDEEEDESDTEPEKEPQEEIEEDNYDDSDEDYNENTKEELKDLVVIDEDELELEQ